MQSDEKDVTETRSQNSADVPDSLLAPRNSRSVLSGRLRIHRGATEVEGQGRLQSAIKIVAARMKAGCRLMSPLRPKWTWAQPAALTLQARRNISLPGIVREVAQALMDGAHRECYDWLYGQRHGKRYSKRRTSHLRLTQLSQLPVCITGRTDVEFSEVTLVSGAFRLAGDQRRRSCSEIIPPRFPWSPVALMNMGAFSPPSCPVSLVTPSPLGWTMASAPLKMRALCCG